MAEGHAVHGIAGRLRQLVGQPVRSTSPKGAFDAALFDGRVFADAQAVGKHLLVTARDVPMTAHVHLAMDGAFSIRRHRRALDGALPRTDPPVHGNVAWRMLTATHHAELTDPAVCELLDDDGVLALRARLGPDPLREDAEPEAARRRIRNSRRPIGALLIDQKSSRASATSIAPSCSTAPASTPSHQATTSPTKPLARSGPTRSTS